METLILGHLYFWELFYSFFWGGTLFGSVFFFGTFSRSPCQVVLLCDMNEEEEEKDEDDFEEVEFL